MIPHAICYSSLFPRPTKCTISFHPSHPHQGHSSRSSSQGSLQGSPPQEYTTQGPQVNKLPGIRGPHIIEGFFCLLLPICIQGRQALLPTGSMRPAKVLSSLMNAHIDSFTLHFSHRVRYEAVSYSRRSNSPIFINQTNRRKLILLIRTMYM